MRRFTRLSAAIALAAVVSVSGGVAFAALGGAPKPGTGTTTLDLKSGLVGWWKLDGNAKDSSGYNNNGTFSAGSTPVADRAGKANGAMKFDGITGGMTVPDNPTLRTGSMTVSFWFSLTNSIECDANNNWRTLARKGNANASSVNGWNVVLEETSGPQFDVGLGATNRLPASGLFVPGSKDLITFSYDAGSGLQTTYKNGVVAAQRTLTPGPIATSTNSFAIAAGTAAVACPNGQGYTPGTYDDVRLYNRALSTVEISALVASNDSTPTTIAAVKSNAGEDGLVAQYKFDGDTKDDSPFANNGSATATTYAADRKTIANKALAYNGSSSIVSAPNTASLNQTGAISVSAWVKPSTFTSFNSGYATIVQKRISSNDQPYSLMLGNGGGLNASWKVSSGGDVNGFTGITVGYVVPANVWSLVTYTRTATQSFLYVNGAQVAVANNGYAVAPPVGNSLPLNIGGSTSQYSGFNGLMDDVRIYSKALSAADLKRQYDSYNSQIDVGNLQKGLIGYWPFNGNAKDLTPNAVNGVVVGATTTNDRKGRANSAYRFDETASARIQIGSTSTYPNLTQTGFTQSVWLMRTKASAFRWPQIMGAPDMHINYGIRSQNYGDSISFEYGTAPYLGSTYTNIGIAALPLNTWLMYTVTYNGTTACVYANGSLVQCGNMALNPASQQWTFGLNPQSFDGYMDDARLYNRPLTAGEVNQMYREYR